MQPPNPNLPRAMDFDFPEIDDMPPTTQSSQPVSMTNLLNAPSHTPAFSNPLPWAPHPPSDLPPPLHPPQNLNKRRPPLPEQKPQQTKVPVVPNDNLPIDAHAVDQMGGLAYADLCKERAREQFKEMKKSEHMANGDYDRIRRRKKGDTSMNAREKYVRRLRMNQDSAAAARHAQEVYVHVLEKLVKTGEEEKKVMGLELGQLRQEISRLRQQNSSLNSRVGQLEEAANNQSNTHNNPDAQALLDAAGDRRYDAFQVAKFVDMLTTPEPVSAQAQDRDFAEGRVGIQLPRAV